MPDHIQAFVSLGLWGDLRGVGDCQAVGFYDGKDLVAGVLYHNFDPDAGVIEMTAYSARRDWLTKDRLQSIMAYPFTGAGCRMVVARIAEGNARARRIWRSFGAKEYLVPDLRRAGEAECIQTLAADDWRASRFMR